MDVLLRNSNWMLENISLAFLGVAIGWTFLYMKKTHFKIFFFILWLLFVPNTIYLVTDLQYLPKQFINADNFIRLILLAQYVLILFLGVATFILGLRPLEKILSKFKKNTFLVISTIAVVNFLIAFAVVLGKFQRTNSWYVFTDTQRVIEDSTALLAGPNMVMKIIIFGIFCNILYFSFRKRFKLDQSKLQR